MRKTQLLDNDPNSIYGASKQLANVSIRNIIDNPVQNDAMLQNLNTSVMKNTNVEEFLGKILDCDSYLQQMYLYAYSALHQYGNHGRYSYKDRGTSDILEREEPDDEGAGLSDDEDEEDDSLNKDQLDKLNFFDLLDYYEKKSKKRNSQNNNNKSSDSEKTYKMTDEDYRSIGVNSPLPKRKAPLKPSPLDIMKASMANSSNRRIYLDNNTSEEFFYDSPQSSISSHGNPMKRGSSSNSSTSNMSKDSLNNPREYYFYDSSNPSGSNSSSSSSLSNRSNSSNPSFLSSEWTNPNNSLSSSSSRSSYYPASSNSSGTRSNNSFNPPSLPSTTSLPSEYFTDGDDSLSTLTGFTDEDDEFTEPPLESQLIGEMSKFNTKMNELYVFFKGKIKPNLKTISKQDIQDILKDMSQLNYNFTDVLHAIEDLGIFGLEKDLKLKHPKIDAFKQTFETNFKKSSADIINNVKAYSSLGQYSTSSLPDDMLFNSKFPTFDGKGLTLVPDSVRKNMHHSRKYLQ